MKMVSDSRRRNGESFSSTSVRKFDSVSERRSADMVAAVGLWMVGTQ